MNYLNWEPQKDIYLKSKEIEIHNAYHEKLALEYKDISDVLDHRNFRIKALDKALDKYRNELSGSFLEVGAGDGWCSAYLLRSFPNLTAHIMEINEAAVNDLIPKVMELGGIAKNRFQVAKGSFNHIPLKNHFDFSFAMGALHHSENLFKTFREIYESLKPGGVLIAQEPCCENETSNEAYFARGETSEDFKGILTVQNNERSDIFYRLCEFQTAALHAGFDLEIEILAKNFRKKIRSLIKPDPYTEFGLKTLNILIMAKKPKEKFNRIPITSWEY